MGILQSKNRINKCGSYIQTPIFGRYTVKNEEILGRCSTFSKPVSASPAGAAAAVRCFSTTPVLPPLSKRTKYDPVYMLWKNAFEDQQARSPRKVSPIKEENQHSQNITDAVAGQLTPRGFPSHTDLNRRKVITPEDVKQKLALKARRRLSLDGSTRRQEPSGETLQKAAQDTQTPLPTANRNESIESCYESVLINKHKIAQTDFRAVRKAVNNIDKLVTKIKYRNAKSNESKLLPKPAVPKPSQTPGCNSHVFMKKLPNTRTEIIEKIYYGIQDMREAYK